MGVRAVTPTLLDGPPMTGHQLVSYTDDPEFPILAADQADGCQPDAADWALARLEQMRQRLERKD